MSLFALHACGFKCFTKCFHSASLHQKGIIVISSNQACYWTSVPINTYWWIQAPSLTLKLALKSSDQIILKICCANFRQFEQRQWLPNLENVQTNKCFLPLCINIKVTNIRFHMMRFTQTGLLLLLPRTPLWVLWCFFALSSANTLPILMGSLGSTNVIWWRSSGQFNLGKHDRPIVRIDSLWFLGNSLSVSYLFVSFTNCGLFLLFNLRCHKTGIPGAKVRASRRLIH